MIYIYIPVGIIILFVVFTLYVKVKYKFWSSQPVYHFYDVKYYFFPPGIIYPQLPQKGKFFNELIKHDIFSETHSLEKNEFCRFVKDNYLKSYDVKYIPSENNILPYFEGHNNKCYISTFKEKKTLTTQTNDKLYAIDTLTSCMTTRPLYCEIYKTNGSLPPFECNYVDYLCVDSRKRKKGVAADTIFTHAYYTRRKNKSVIVSLFKREDTLTGIVPLCVFDIYVFNTTRWRRTENIPPTTGKVIKCPPTSLYMLSDFIQDNKSDFEFFGTSSLGNIQELMKTQNVFIYMFIDTNNDIQAAYFFRNACTVYNNRANSTCLFASIKGRVKPELFMQCFKISLMNLLANRGDFDYLSIENVSNNNIIVDNLKQKSKEMIKSKGAYFFYNFAYFTFHPNKVIIIN